MIIKSLKIQNLQLIKSAQVDFDKINIISGINKDSPSESGNGSGKSTFVLRAILFGLYGYVEEGLKLVDLIRFDEKESSVTLEITNNNENYRIIRKIPSELQIFLNEKEIQANTASIKQNLINETFGDINFFRQYRCCDLKNGINTLDLGIVSLRKSLMNFIESYFTEIRTKLLAKKVERERYSIDKKLYKHYLSVKRLNLLNASLNELKNDYLKFEKEKDVQQGIINQIKSEISSREKIIYNKKRELEEAQKSGICPILKIKCLQITKQITSEQKEKMNQEVERLYQEIEQYKNQLESEIESVGYYDDTLLALRNKEEKAREKLLRLKGAFQFKDYKYSKVDIIIYDEAIKILDLFAGVYIKTWLESLQIIINNLLQSINISVKFVADKDFLLIMDNSQLLKYSQLSSGQCCFLNIIFKLGILYQKNITNGVILCDDGMNVIDNKNFKQLVDMLKTLGFQFIIVKQDINTELENVKQINIIRENNESKII